MVGSHECEDLKMMSENLPLFIYGALSGEIRCETGGNDSGKEPVGSGQTPVSRGLTEGYSPADIAYFYIARELGTSWLARLTVGYKEFCEDVRFEEKYAGPEMFCLNKLEKGKDYE